MYYGSVLVEAPNRRKLEILRFIASRASKGENPPSVREVGAAVGLRSSRSAHAHLEARRGRVCRAFGERGEDGAAYGERVGCCPGREHTPSGENSGGPRARSRSRGRRGLFSGRRASTPRLGQTPLSLKGGGAEHDGSENRGWRPVGCRGGRGSAGWRGGRRTAEGRGVDREEVAPRRRDRATQVPERWIRGHSGSRRGRESAGPGGLRRPPSIELLRSLMRRERGALSVEQWAKLSLNASRKGIP